MRSAPPADVRDDLAGLAFARRRRGLCPRHGGAGVEQMKKGRKGEKERGSAGKSPLPPFSPSPFLSQHFGSHFRTFIPMATIIIRKTWTLDGAPANPDSIVLSDPTGAYGIRRDDTGVVIVAAGTPMSQIATGVFEYIIDGR